MSITTAIPSTLLPFHVNIDVQVPQTPKRTRPVHSELGAPTKPKRRIFDENIPIPFAPSPSTPTPKPHASVCDEFQPVVQPPAPTSLHRTRTLSGRMALAYKPWPRVTGENLPVVNHPEPVTLKRTRTLSGKMAKAYEPIYRASDEEVAIPDYMRPPVYDY